MNNVHIGYAGQPAEQRQCFKCNYEAVSPAGACPRCRCPKFLTAGNIRIRGMVLVGVGLFLVLFMVAIALFVGIMLYGSANTDPAAARKISAESHILVVAFLLFGSLIGFGIHSVISGTWMIAFGKRNRFMLWVMWAILLTIGVIAVILRVFLQTLN